MTWYGIVMGDIVSSREHTLQLDLSHVFNEAVLRANQEFAEHILSPLTITLGDEFQGICQRVASAYDIAKYLRLELRRQNVTCRFVVGYGRIETQLNKQSAWNMMGEGLSEARQQLNDKKNSSAYRFSLTRSPAIEIALGAIGHTLTEIENAWTARQFDYVYDMIGHSSSVQAVSAATGVSARAVYKSLQSANWDLYRVQDLAVTEILKQIDENREGLV